MRYMTILISLLLTLTAFVHTPEPELRINVVPQPASVTMGKGIKKWGTSITLVARSAEEKQAASVLSTLLQAQGFHVTPVEKSKDASIVAFAIVNDARLGAEGYNLSVTASGATLQANTGAGLFYGTQTLAQLTAEKETPFAEITDYPRFAYRGMHLDVGRHMFPPEFIKKYIDLMARHKYNRFHWHLTEDQGWRIEIKKYPKLKEISAHRKETSVGRQTTRTRPQAKYDGEPYGGYYTQEEIKGIVRYAAGRHVTIVPEIELPGHAQAALAAYPDLGCTGGPYEVATSWGVFKDVYCAGKEETFAFLQDVLDEVLVLFPGEYIHIGGDECPKDRWKSCARCQQRITTENLKDEQGLQSYFVGRMEKYLNSKGRQIIGWDEILEGGLAPNATVMSWRGEQGGIAAARANHNVIMTPENWCYLDHAQDTSRLEPLSIGNYTPVREVYGYEPVPPQLNASEALYVIGGQCNLWTEYIKTPEHAEYMVYPRAVALAEVLWSPKEKRDYADFIRRMKTHTRRLSGWNVNYARHIEREFE